VTRTAQPLGLLVTPRWRIGDSNPRCPRRRDNRRDRSQLSARGGFQVVAERTGLNAGYTSALFEEAAALYSCGSRDRTGIAKRFAKRGRLPVDVTACRPKSPQLHYAILVQPSGIKQLASSAVISTMRSSPMVMCRPDNVWTAPIPGGALRRT